MYPPIGLPMAGDRAFTHALYADDLVVACESVNGITRALHLITSVGAGLGLQVNAAKSGVMPQYPRPRAGILLSRAGNWQRKHTKGLKTVQQELQVDGRPVAKVATYQYLGTTITAKVSYQRSTTETDASLQVEQSCYTAARLASAKWITLDTRVRMLNNAASSVGGYSLVVPGCTSMLPLRPVDKPIGRVLAQSTIGFKKHLLRPLFQSLLAACGLRASHVLGMRARLGLALRVLRSAMPDTPAMMTLMRSSEQALGGNTADLSPREAMVELIRLDKEAMYKPDSGIEAPWMERVIMEMAVLGYPTIRSTLGGMVTIWRQWVDGGIDMAALSGGVSCCCKDRGGARGGLRRGRWTCGPGTQAPPCRTLCPEACCPAPRPKISITCHLGLQGECGGEDHSPADPTDPPPAH